MDKARLKAFAIQARKKLFAEISHTIQAVAERKIKAGPPYEAFLQLQRKIACTDRKILAQQAATLWFERLLAVWFLEVNGYLPGQQFFAHFTKEGFLQSDASGSVSAKAAFLQICRKLSAVFPKLFGAQQEPWDFLLPKFGENSFVYDFFALPKQDFIIAQGGQIEALGWLYQYFQAEQKEEAFNLLARNVKLKKEHIPAATQFFTPYWLVQYMVQNSVGRLWLQACPDKALEKKWRFYLKSQERELHKTRLKPQELTVLDPCMGSGHILVYAFELLMDIYHAQGYASKEAVREILQCNLFGLDIDDTVSALAHFTVMMKAREYDESVLEQPPYIHLYSLCESNELPAQLHTEITQATDFTDRQKQILIQMLELFTDAKIYGSCLQMPPEFLPQEYRETAEALSHARGQLVRAYLPQLTALLEQAAVLAQSYMVTVTNPPYMGKKSMPQALNVFLQQHYSEGKSELYAAFILRCKNFTKLQGCFAMVTVHSWLFLTSFEKLRVELLRHCYISSLVHAGAATFEELNDFNVLATAFVIDRQKAESAPSLFINLADSLDTEQKINGYFCNQNHVRLMQDLFYQIPGISFIYRAHPNALAAFFAGIPLAKIAPPRVGMQTGNNKVFVRFWHEVDYTKFCTTAQNAEQAQQSGAVWFPYNKGGNFRKWYGMNEYAVNFENGGAALRDYSGAVLRNENDYFKPGITWSLFGFENFAVRWKPSGFLFDVSGSSLFPRQQIEELLAFLCSKVAFYFLSLLAPTVNFQAGNVGDLPILPSGEHGATLRRLALENCRISKQDWDSFEISWDFACHPFLAISRDFGEKNLQNCYRIWSEQTEKRYRTLRKNEEEINRIFIGLYGLGECVTPQVADRDIAIRRADLSRDAFLFLSYLVGCLFGRYHPDKSGIWYAGGNWNAQKAHRYTVKENFLQLSQTPLPNPQQDLAEQLFLLLEALFGKENFAQNVAFLASAFDPHSKDPKQTIRTYLWRDFYKEHVKMYRKCPIYWQLDSGKNGKNVAFKGLFYLHRSHKPSFLKAEACLQAHIRELKRRNVSEAVLQQLFRYCRAYTAAIPALCDMDLNRGVQQNYAEFMRLPIEEDSYLALFSKF